MRSTTSQGRGWRSPPMPTQERCTRRCTTGTSSEARVHARSDPGAGGGRELSGEYLVFARILSHLLVVALLVLTFTLLRRRCPTPVALMLSSTILVSGTGLAAATSVRNDVLPVILQLGAIDGGSASSPYLRGGARRRTRCFPSRERRADVREHPRALIRHSWAARLAARGACSAATDRRRRPRSPRCATGACNPWSARRRAAAVVDAGPRRVRVRIGGHGDRSRGSRHVHQPPDRRPGAVADGRRRAVMAYVSSLGRLVAGLGGDRGCAPRGGPISSERRYR